MTVEARQQEAPVETLETLERVEALKRPRAEVLGRTIEKRLAEIAELEAKVVELAEREEKARLEAIRLAPEQRVYRMGSQAGRLKADRLKVEQKAANLRLEVESLRRVHAEAEEDKGEKLRAELKSAASRFDKREKAAWQAFGKAYAELAARYNDVLEVVHERDSYYQGIAWTSEQDREQVGALFCPVQAPFPADLTQALILATDAAVDPRGRGYRDGQSGLGHIVEVTPDLRGQVGNAKEVRGEKTGYLEGEHPGYGFGAAMGGEALGFGRGPSPAGLAGVS